MANRNAEQSQGECGSPPSSPPPPPDDPSAGSRVGNTVFKSGPLFLSSKGIGWTSWKKRWFILTRTSLVFFRSDPNAAPQKGGEVNLTLGGIDLNNSGSVVVKSEKKLLTVLFPDGREGRAFTLKAETLEDLYEWKAALETALSQAPSSVHANGIFKNDKIESNDGSSETLKDGSQLGRPKVLGRPVLLALEDVDGTPSFLEKALRFIEDHGVKVEGILRQAADVDDVERRVRDYEQGKIEFSPEEDAHVVADCVKYVIRELPSSPVPASCCNALLEASKTDRGNRVNAMRSAIYETFPEPNRRLLQRILMMMQTVASRKAENRMSSSAVAACMAPLLLRPLLSGDCEIETDFDVGGDGSIQLLRAAAAANHAQAIVITLLEEYDIIFGEGSLSPIMYSDSEESGSESEEASDDDMSYDDEEQDDVTGSDAETDDGVESTGTCSGSVYSEEHDLSGDKGSEVSSGSPKNSDVSKVNGRKPKSSSPKKKLPQVRSKKTVRGRGNPPIKDEKPCEEYESEEANMMHKLDPCSSSSFDGSPSKSSHTSRRLTVWGRTPAKKNLSMESMDLDFDEEVEIQKLEATKYELQNKILEEAKENFTLQSSLENQKKFLHERRITLEQEVARLKGQLQKERDLRMALEVGLKISQGPLPSLANISEKTKADLEEIDQAEKDIANLNNMVADFEGQLDRLRPSSDSRNASQNHQTKSKDKKKDAGALALLHPEHFRNKDILSGQAENGNEKKAESSSSTSKHSPHNQHPDHHAIVRSVGFPTMEALAPRSTALTNLKRAAARVEGSNLTSSALTKLTTRLNFLKERRSQIANELQNMDRGRVSGQSLENTDKGRGAEAKRSVQNSDVTQGSSSQDSDKRAGTDSSSSSSQPRN
ncbi:Rho GTPase-activating protein REN1, partial [Cucurbita argyrosperma subsp. sororia]